MHTDSVYCCKKPYISLHEVIYFYHKYLDLYGTLPSLQQMLGMMSLTYLHRTVHLTKNVSFLLFLCVDQAGD
jgi:hypothetical protein